MGAVASQITSLKMVFSTVYSDADQRKHQIPASLVFVRGIHRGPMKWPVTRKMFPFDDVIMSCNIWFDKTGSICITTLYIGGLVQWSCYSIALIHKYTVQHRTTGRMWSVVSTFHKLNNMRLIEIYVSFRTVVIPSNLFWHEHKTEKVNHPYSASNSIK